MRFNIKAKYITFEEIPLNRSFFHRGYKYLKTENAKALCSSNDYRDNIQYIFGSHILAILL